MDLVYGDIISDTTHYGVIWAGKYIGQKCIIKVVLLNTGLHYDRNTHKYYNDKIRTSNSAAFEKDGNVPYLNTKYQKRKSMSIDKFNHEVNMLKTISKLELAPKLLTYWIDQISPIHYGFIVMERMESTVKDILLQRDLSSIELKYIHSKIRELHDTGITHGDLKPSNIGIYLDSSGFIKQIRMIDWAKGQYTNNKDNIHRDIFTFKSHMKKNISERK